MDNKITFRGLGPKETELIARLSYEKKTIVSAGDIAGFLPADFKYRNQFVYNLKQKRILTPIKRGIYIFNPLEAVPSGIRVNEFVIPPVFFPRKNYYIGYSLMFNYYGFTDQLFQTVYVLNTSLCQERIICGVSYKFVKVSDDRMYGAETISVRDTGVIVSSRERTLVDLIYFNKPVGGADQAAQIFRNIVDQKKCDIIKLIKYAARFPNITARKRIGMIFEELGIKKPVLRPLIKSVENTAISSLTGSRKGALNKTWQVIVNDT
ncbi:MAG: type IV toxin-antitoxin system AbiEi family antitoxin [Kiritimatiellia bacterium]|nr:type IV toxin-antitoxin system AbiEi family antitoxin [Kiritimatiellia bacterium]